MCKFMSIEKAQIKICFDLSFVKQNFLVIEFRTQNDSRLFTGKPLNII